MSEYYVSKCKGSIMKQKAIFLDRDGTINVEKNYLYKIEEFEYLDGVKEGLRLLQNEGYMLVIITNQSGIARGFYSEEDYQRLKQWMLTDLEQSGIHITECYHCPHLPDAPIKKYRWDCNCRKPKLGLFLQAIETYNIDLEQSYAIGDKIRDLEICKQFGLHGYLVYADKSGEEVVDNHIKRIPGGILEAALDIREGDNK